MVHFSPKSLLRHPRVVSHVDELTNGKFQEFIDDGKTDTGKVRRVLWCTGKIYFELLEKQEEDNIEDVVIVRIEQLYPLAKKQLDALLNKYKGKEHIWVQEEPKNMGAWTFLHRFRQFLDFRYVGRRSSSSPATGHGSVHKREQLEIVERAFSKSELKKFS